VYTEGVGGAMAGANLLGMRTAFLQLFEMLRLGYPLEAATYYVVYTSTFPDIRTFEGLHREARTLVEGIKPGALRRGRDELVQQGFMARVLFSHEAEEFGQEAYIPANPKLVWEAGEERLRGVLASDMFDTMRRAAEGLSKEYDDNFGEYGLSIEEGKITVYYSGVWVTFILLNLCRKSPRQVSITVRGSKSFIAPSLDYFRKCLDTGSKIRILLDHKGDPEALKELTEEHPSDVEVSLASLGPTHRTTLVDDVFALDSIRIVTPQLSAPAYIGTAYLERADIERLARYYEAKWRGEDEGHD
jgi:hypothetical protein